MTRYFLLHESLLPTNLEKKSEALYSNNIFFVNRYNKLLLYMGLPLHQAKELKISSFCKTVSEFALEYRTTREKVVQQLEKKANQRERKKTRGKMIVDVSIRFR